MLTGPDAAAPAAGALAGGAALVAIARDSPAPSGGALDEGAAAGADPAVTGALPNVSAGAEAAGVEEAAAAEAGGVAGVPKLMPARGIRKDSLSSAAVFYTY